MRKFISVILHAAALSMCFYAVLGCTIHLWLPACITTILIHIYFKKRKLGLYYEEQR